MSKINILGIVDTIKSKTNVYSPIIESIVNSIEAIQEAKNSQGEIIITIKRENVFDLDGSLPAVVSLEIQDNGIGFNKKNRDSFDTYYSYEKRNIGGKGFGRFLFLKYFDNVKIDSIYQDNGQFYNRKFSFGKKFDIIVNETNNLTENKELKTIVYLDNFKGEYPIDKQLDTIARKIIEKLLFFFVNPKFTCPKIILKESNGSQQIELNHYLITEGEIIQVDKRSFKIETVLSNRIENFETIIFKIYYPSNQRSKICLTAGNREVTENSLHNYIPEFEDDFYDEFDRPTGKITKNYIIKAYVQGDYLDQNVEIERESFNFDKEKSNSLYEISQLEIEKKIAEIVKEKFITEVTTREDKKKKRIRDYVNQSAPWHRIYFNELEFSKIPYTINEEKIELEFQKIKFQKEQESKIEIQAILISDDKDFEKQLNQVVSKITEIGKNDLARYVSNRRVILNLIKELLKRREDGRGHLEKEIHNIIFPMRKDSEQVEYEEHNLWLLDERLVFSEYVASDRKISKSALREPDLIIFDKKQCFRNGENEFSNPLTIFEFKRPKREDYTQAEDPILQIANYLQEIRDGKYELDEGLEKIKVNENTPVYGYVICDITKKIDDFAKIYQLTKSPDNEGYFGFHSGFKIYVEIISYKKLLKDATIRNKIFFKMLKIE